MQTRCDIINWDTENQWMTKQSSDRNRFIPSKDSHGNHVNYDLEVERPSRGRKRPWCSNLINPCGMYDISELKFRI